MRPTIEMLLENKKIIIRAALTVAYYAMIFYALYLIYFHKIDKEQKDILMFILGAVIASFSKVTDYWFPKHDEDDKKSDAPVSK